MTTRGAIAGACIDFLRRLKFIPEDLQLVKTPFLKKDKMIVMMNDESAEHILVEKSLVVKITDGASKFHLGLGTFESFKKYVLKRPPSEVDIDAVYKALGALMKVASRIDTVLNQVAADQKALNKSVESLGVKVSSIHKENGSRGHGKAAAAAPKGNAKANGKSPVNGKAANGNGNGNVTPPKAPESPPPESPPDDSDDDD